MCVSGSFACACDLDCHCRWISVLYLEEKLDILSVKLYEWLAKMDGSCLETIHKCRNFGSHTLINLCMPWTIDDRSVVAKKVQMDIV